MTDAWIMDEFDDGSDLPNWFGHACTGCGEFLHDNDGAKPWKDGDGWAHPWCFPIVGFLTPEQRAATVDALGFTSDTNGSEKKDLTASEDPGQGTPMR